MPSDALWINSGKDASVGTATIATDGTFTITAHGLADGDTVTVDTLTGGAVGVLVADAVYFVRDSAANTFKVALSQAGEAVTFASTGGAAVYRFAPQYNAAELRRAFGGLLQRGDASGGFAARSGVFPDASVVTGVNIVSLAGTTWTVKDHCGTIWTNQGSSVGPYLYAHLSESGSTAAADGTNPRIDVLDVQIQDDDVDASGFRRAQVVYTTGTPAASPSPPAALSSAVRLAEILVPAGGSPSPSLTFVAPITVARGGVVPVPDSSKYPASGGRYQGMMLWDVDLEALIVNQDASDSWKVIASPIGVSQVAYKAATESVASSITVQDDNDLHLPMDANAVYQMEAMLMVGGSSSGDFRFLWVGPSGVTFKLGFYALLGAATDGTGINLAIRQETDGEGIVGTVGTGAAARPVLFNGIVVVGGTAGDFKLRWAQWVSDATSTSIREGSYLKLVRVA